MAASSPKYNQIDNSASGNQKIEQNIEYDEENNCFKASPKYDGRLFPECPLYCEGLHKPYFRGILHLFCALLLPGATFVIFQASLFYKAKIAGVMYCCTNMFCYGMSGCYHVFTWQPRTEILLQKLDHCGIGMLSVGTILPLALIILPDEAGMMLLMGSIVAYVALCYKIFFQLTPSLTLQAVVAIWWVIPFLTELTVLLTPFELQCMWGTIFFQICGVVTFSARKPTIISNYIEYHEVFHFFVVMAGVCVYLCNLSMVTRANK